MRRLVTAAAVVFTAAILSACVNISYDGISKEPLPSNEKVNLYFSKDQIPGKDYKVMGKLTASAGTTYSAAEVEGKIKNFAREKGANGVLITDIKRVFEGEARPDQIKNQPSYQWIVDGSSGNAFRYFRENMLDYSKKEGPEKPIYDITIEAELLTVPETAK